MFFLTCSVLFFPCFCHVSSQWWHISTGSKSGYVPATYLREVTDEDDWGEDSRIGEKVAVAFDFEAATANELTVAAGQVRDSV